VHARVRSRGTGFLAGGDRFLKTSPDDPEGTPTVLSRSLTPTGSHVFGLGGARNSEADGDAEDSREASRLWPWLRGVLLPLFPRGRSGVRILF